jgi:hypothetical protein
MLIIIIELIIIIVYNCHFEYKKLINNNKLKTNQ